MGVGVGVLVGIGVEVGVGVGKMGVGVRVGSVFTGINFVLEGLRIFAACFCQKIEMLNAQVNNRSIKIINTFNFTWIYYHISFCYNCCMILWQTIFLIIFGIFNCLIYLRAITHITKYKNVYGLTKWLFFIGAFVWGDVFVLAPFWIIAAIAAFVLNNWNLFLLIVTIFWTIRSLGEITYWLNEQFAGKNRNPPSTLNFHKVFNGDAIWFIYQLFWQCVFILSLILSLYFAKLWLLSV
jgi:hypothetical protein